MSSKEEQFDVIIIGGSFAGLSAAMALGRSLREVLVIDSGLPCNRQTPHSHNLITHDGSKPGDIAAEAKSQVLAYPGVKLVNDKAIDAEKLEEGFLIRTENQAEFMGRKLIFATGVRDIMPSIEGFAACWGISILHCPYCHGYEVRNEALGIIGNGDMGYEMVKLIENWSKQLVLLTNGRSTLTDEQTEKLRRKNVKIIESEINAVRHVDGYMDAVEFTDGTNIPLNALFARVAFEQHSKIPENLGCEKDAQGLLIVNDFQQTTVPGVMAAGDNSSPLRALSKAIASGGFAGAWINKELIEERF